MSTLANYNISLIPTVFTDHNGKYQSWNGTEQAIIGAAEKATDGKDNGQDQETIASIDRSVCVDSRSWLFLDNNYITGLEKYIHIMYST